MASDVAVELTMLSDEELIEATESAIVRDATLSSRGRFSAEAWSRLDRLYGECQRRTPNGHLYQRAWNRAAVGVCARGPVPPDVRRAGV